MEQRLKRTLCLFLLLAVPLGGCARVYTTSDKIGSSVVERTPLTEPKMVRKTEQSSVSGTAVAPAGRGAVAASASQSNSLSYEKCMREFRIKTKHAYDVTTHSDGAWKDYAWGGLFIVSGLVGVATAASAEDPTSATESVAGGVASLGISIPFFFHAANASSKDGSVTRQNRYKVTREWQTSQGCDGAPTTKQAKRVEPTEPDKTLTGRSNTDNDAECLTDKVCVSQAQCLGSQICDTSRGQCIRRACVVDSIAGEILGIRQSIYNRAVETATAMRKSVSNPDESNSAETSGQRVRSGDRSNRSGSSAKKQTFSLKEAANVCGVSRGTVRGWIRSGKLRAVKTGEGFIISRAELARTWRALGGGELFE
jgi:excisionase family DNA binding protein